MFTKLQINKIKYLIKIPKYGIILETAYKNWNTDVKVRFRDFGLTAKYDPESNKYFLSSNCACLLSASLIGQQIKKPKFFHLIIHQAKVLLQKVYNVSEDEMWSIIYGFDGNHYTQYMNKEAYNFGREIRLLVRKRTAVK